jgi:hypothetical protein
MTVDRQTVGKKLEVNYYTDYNVEPTHVALKRNLCSWYSSTSYLNYVS